MAIRPVRDSDKDQLWVIARTFLEPVYGPQEKSVHEWLTGSGYKHAFVFEHEGVFAGLLSLKANPNKDYLKISTLVVLEQFRGKKIGTQFLDFSTKIATDLGYENMVATVSVLKIETALFLFEYGFDVVRVYSDKYVKGVNELVLLKRLDAHSLKNR